MNAPDDCEEGSGRRPGPARRFRAGRHGVLPAVLVVCHVALLAFGATQQSPTTDEPVRLVAGLRIWKTGRFDLNKGNPHLVDMVAALPLLLTDAQVDFSQAPGDFQVAIDFLKRNQPACFWYITYARWACIPFAVLGAWTCYRWAFELFGPSSAAAALALWVFCPNILGHGQLVSADVAATSVGLLAFYLFWKWLCEPDWRGALLCGGALGLAELTKYV